MLIMSHPTWLIKIISDNSFLKNLESLYMYSLYEGKLLNMSQMVIKKKKNKKDFALYVWRKVIKLQMDVE